MSTEPSNKVAVTGTPQSQALLKTKNFFNREEVMGKFKKILGEDRAVGFVTSVLQIISADKYLANIEPQSIYQAAAMAAVLNLPINNNLGYAWIVPYKGKAQMQIGWRGFVQLALRTNQYKHINVIEVYANQFKSYDPITETLRADFEVEGEGAIAGYCAYFQLLAGFEKTVYWSTRKVTEHAKKYSKAFTHPTADTPWKHDDQFPEMAKKTVLKNMLSKWGILSIEMERASIADQSVVKDIDTLDIDYIDNPENQETVDTTTGEIALVDENKATVKTENKIEAKLPEPAATVTEKDYTGFKVRTVNNIYNVKQEEVPAGFVGMCSADNGITVTINNGIIVCPRSAVKIAPADEPLTVVAEPEIKVETPAPPPGHGIVTPPSIRNNYTVDELKDMQSGPIIRNIAAQYCVFDKLDDKAITNAKLRNIILHAQDGKLKWFITKFYGAEKVMLVRDTYIETYVPETTEAPKVSGKVAIDGLVDVATDVERDVDEAMAVYIYLQNNGIGEMNIGKILDTCGEGYFDGFSSLEHLCKTANLEQVKFIVNTFDKSKQK